jgi:isopenicillin N synthase-like dioxygenase
LTILPKTEIHFETHSLPPITSEPANAIRAAAHGDINLITLLMGAQGKGLQVKTTTKTGLMQLLNQMNW